MTNFTFRKIPRTGRFRSFEQYQTEIKLNKKVVGLLLEDVHKDHWWICFAIKKEKTERSPAPFKWIKLKYKPHSEEQGREFILKFNDKIQEKYDLHSFDN